MVTYNGFSAWICSEGQRLREYEVKVERGTNKVSCWVPCEIEKRFSMHWEDHGSGIDSAAFIVLDGFTVPGQFLFGSGTAQRSGVRISADVERPFVFAEVQDGSSARNKDLGTIVLKIKQVRLQGLTHDPNPPRTPPSQANGRLTAGVPASIGYGLPHAVEVQHPKTYACEPYDRAHPGSFVYFCFRYRPAEFLVTQGIMPESEIDRTGHTLPAENVYIWSPVAIPAVKIDPDSNPVSRRSSNTYPDTSNGGTPRSNNSSVPGSSFLSFFSTHRSSASHQGTSEASNAAQVPRSFSGGHYRRHTYQASDMEPPTKRHKASED